VSVHARTQIRRAVAKMLTNLPTTQERVFEGYPWEINPEELPALEILSPSERIDEDFSSSTGGVNQLGRRVTLIIVGYTTGDDIEDRLDQIALEVERAIGADRTLGGTVIDSEITATEFAVAVDEVRVGQVQLTYEAIYRTTRAAPETILD
jgi:hypothetical protein